MAIEKVMDIPSDNVYAYALSKTLTKVSSPVTVGLYSECHNRINMVLKNIEVHMDQEAKRRETNTKEPKPRSITPSVSDLLSLILRLLFYRPVWTEQNQNMKNIRYLFVRFSAWHFAGSDLLWAGLVMQLCKALQNSFGKLQLGLFRIAQHDPEEDARKKKIEDISKNWRSKKLACIPFWVLILMGFIGSLLILVPLIIYGFPDLKDYNEGEEVESTSGSGVLEGFAIAVLGVPAVGALRFIFLLLKNLIFNQDLKIRQGLDNKKVSQQLGLMHEVRKEMRLLCCFIYFMEVFERRRIRVVLEITNLDRCTPKKIVGVLDAINILLSDEESPFISVLAVDPEVLVRQVEQAENCVDKRDSAYDFLDRIITLPFTVPPLSDASKSSVFENIVRGQSEISEDIPLEGTAASTSSPLTSFSVEDEYRVKCSETEEQVTPLIANTLENSKTFAATELNLNEVDSLIESAFSYIFSRQKSKLQSYISGNTMSMRRVINSIQVTILIMETQKLEPPPPEKIAAWVVLVDRWPCRLSWIIQCVEDDQQSKEINGSFCAADKTKTIWDVFNYNSLELCIIGNEVENFLERDGDPELFEVFLRKDFEFTVGELEMFQLYTVNLNYSIKNELARVRGSRRLKIAGRNAFQSLSSQTVVNMKTDDICQELSKLSLPEKYLETVRKNFIDGRTILFSDTKDLRQVLQMTLGEWTTFKIHFLGVMPPSRPAQAKSLRDAIYPGVVICSSDHNS
ncbi:NTPase KAP family P-loop domain-containing protein 1 [Pimephales promelas]|uniref:NTPase KAP family P-loop domain-containing protein 1 n=1 Tax=Pimephales promelas TaxID=90988 RepID=UPI0019555E9D|nr:NTPase KAP family P-loop domain-containing protein 1 [Pimephales promelas]XP_039530089.1 NTPase KAP family P-loop domain-containing protein 1 [Pimephales promelas]XP_039530090.1 NTPase KAP family P-loop domain-containing protein 1 [Pimephales promelas]